MKPEWVDGPVLGIETTGRLSGAALFQRGRLLAERALDARSLRSELLLAIIDDLLRSLGLTVRDLARIGVALGPGSFTGVRVGLAAARGIALGAGLPVVGVPSHEALAWPYADLGVSLVLLTGLRRGEVFLEAGCWNDACWEPRAPGATVAVDGLRTRLEALALPQPRIFLGEAVEDPSLGETIAGLGHAVTEPLASARRPAVVACLAAREGAHEARGAALDTLEPLYLRPADAKRPKSGGTSHG